MIYDDLSFKNSQRVTKLKVFHDCGEAGLLWWPTKHNHHFGHCLGDPSCNAIIRGTNCSLRWRGPSLCFTFNFRCSVWRDTPSSLQRKHALPPRTLRVAALQPVLHTILAWCPSNVGWKWIGRSPAILTMVILWTILRKVVCFLFWILTPKWFSDLLCLFWFQPLCSISSVGWFQIPNSTQKNSGSAMRVESLVSPHTC